MQFGSRYVEEQEPVLYFSNVNMSVLSERDHLIMARGGWANMPHVIWDERSEVQFQMIEGVMSQTEMSILLGANVTERKDSEPLFVQMKEGPYELDDQHRLYLKHWPELKEKKAFIFKYDRDAIQQKVYGKLITDVPDPFDPKKMLPCIEVYKKKDFNQENLADTDDEYVVDYYYEYKDEALIYAIQKERFNGLFTLEGKFYSKDENDGYNYTNIIYMPKVRIASDINLRLGEGADPAVSTFNIIGLPETTGEYKNLIVDITRLNEDIDTDI